MNLEVPAEGITKKNFSMAMDFLKVKQKFFSYVFSIKKIRKFFGALIFVGRHLN